MQCKWISKALHENQVLNKYTIMMLMLMIYELEYALGII